MASIDSEPTAQPGYSLAIDELKLVSLRVRDTFRAMLQYAPGMRPAEVCKRFGFSKDIGSRVIACCELEDPLEFAYRCLSPAAMRRVVHAAKELDSPAADAADLAVDDFERTVRTEFGDQSRMNVLIGSMHPDLRSESEAAQKQSAFRGMSQLHGLFAEVSLQASILMHGEAPATFDRVCAEGCLGLRRLRPGPPVVTGSWQVDPRSGSRIPMASANFLSTDWGAVLGGKPAPGDSQWVSPRTVVMGSTAQVCIHADVLGSRSSVSFGTIARHTSSSRFDPEVGSRWCGVGQLIAVPSKLLIYDLLIEEGLFRDAFPQLVIYDTAIRGTSPLFDPAREFDRLPLTEQVDTLPPGPNGHRCTDAPFLPDLVAHMLKVADAGSRRFRSYRVRQAYPIYGSQVAFAFPRE